MAPGNNAKGKANIPTISHVSEDDDDDGVMNQPIFGGIPSHEAIDPSTAQCCCYYPGCNSRQTRNDEPKKVAEEKKADECPKPVTTTTTTTTTTTPPRANSNNNNEGEAPAKEPAKTFHSLWRRNTSVDEKWQLALGLLSGHRDDGQFVCSDHFNKARDFVDNAEAPLGKLKPDAVPRKVRASFGGLHPREPIGPYHPRILGRSTMFTRDRPCAPGLDGNALQVLYEQMSRMGPRDRVCSLLLDELPVVRRARPDSGEADAYCPNYKCVAMMLRGLQSDWRHMVGYLFSSEPYDAKSLEPLMEQTMRACRMAGCHVVALCVDWQSMLLPAVENLTEYPGSRYYDKLKYKEQSTYIVFDPSRLMRSLRDCLLSHSIMWGPMLKLVPKPSYTAEFEPIRQTFALTRHMRETHLLPRLTEADFDWFAAPSRLERVDVALRQLSRSVSRAIEYQVGCERLPRSALDTAQFVERMDKLYDSLQGVEVNRSRSEDSNDKKPLKAALHRESGHAAFWSEMRREISTWQIEASSRRVASMQNPGEGIKATLCSIQVIWNQLSQLHDFKHMSCKYLDLEPMERLVCFIER